MLSYVNSSYVWSMAQIFKFQNEVELETACGSLGLVMFRGLRHVHCEPVCWSIFVTTRDQTGS
jgi:hypothetical protein